MTVDSYILALADYALEKGLIQPEDRIWAVNRILEVMELPGIDVSAAPASGELHEILEALCADALERGVIEEGITASDLFDTKLMGVLTPAPREVRGKFFSLFDRDPKEATDWFYAFSQDTNYIRKDRIARDIKWVHECEYGSLDITINLSKPEKDPKAIAAARHARPADAKGYPSCQLCVENEGYAGRHDHPARQNHRVIPFPIAGEDWYMQFSPYVYYNEHCIVFNGKHLPMKIDGACFRKLLSFVSKVPHYFVGSNADLPIVGGSILTHDHFQGGGYTFAMEKAPVETELSFSGFEDVKAGIVRWPMSVIRLLGADSERVALLADRILAAWKGWTDEEAVIYAETDGTPHNTITPIARRRGELFELDLVLRNNLTTEERPAGLYHPRPEFHHIKRENIGLIEVMGLAVLPARLKKELAGVREAILEGKDLRQDPVLCIHADWANQLKQKYSFTAENADGILRFEVGDIFKQLLEDAGVYKRTPEGKEAFLRFTGHVNSI